MVRAVFEKTTYAYQAKIISESDVFWASHGAGMVHLPLLPKDAVTVEMFNCGHFSYLYAQLALHVGVRYFVMQRTEPWCYKPQSLYGDTRKNMSKTYAYTFEEAEPVLFQAIRYHMWQDPVEDLSGREPMCDFARKHLAGTGTLPTNVLPNRWSKECAPLVAGPVAADGGSGRADDATASTESALAGSASMALSHERHCRSSSARCSRSPDAASVSGVGAGAARRAATSASREASAASAASAPRRSSSRRSVAASSASMRARSHAVSAACSSAARRSAFSRTASAPSTRPLSLSCALTRACSALQASECAGQCAAWCSRLQ
jgi:hypothetical protein